MWCDTNLTGKIQLYYLNKSYDNPDTDNQIYWEIGLMLPQDIKLMEQMAWERTRLVNKPPATFYAKEFCTNLLCTNSGKSKGGGKAIKLEQKYENVCNSFKEQISCFFKSILTPHWLLQL